MCVLSLSLILLLVLSNFLEVKSMQENERGITEEAVTALKPDHSLVFLDVRNDPSILRDLLAYLKAGIGSLPSSLKLFRHLEEDYILSTHRHNSSAATRSQWWSDRWPNPQGVLTFSPIAEGPSGDLSLWATDDSVAAHLLDNLNWERPSLFFSGKI